LLRRAIIDETYIGAERREHGTVTLEGDWRNERQYVELRKGIGKIVLPFIITFPSQSLAALTDAAFAEILSNRVVSRIPPEDTT
jgi:hypothetical protein